MCMHRDRKILPQDKRRTTLNAGRLKDSTRQRLGFCAWESLPRLRCGLALGSPGSWFGVIIRGAATHEPRFYRQTSVLWTRGTNTSGAQREGWPSLYTREGILYFENIKAWSPSLILLHRHPKCTGKKCLLWASRRDGDFCIPRILPVPISLRWWNSRKSLKLTVAFAFP